MPPKTRGGRYSRGGANRRASGDSNDAAAATTTPVQQQQQQQPTTTTTPTVDDTLLLAPQTPLEAQRAATLNLRESLRRSGRERLVATSPADVPDASSLSAGGAAYDGSVHTTEPEAQPTTPAARGRGRGGRVRSARGRARVARSRGGAVTTESTPHGRAAKAALEERRAAVSTPGGGRAGRGRGGRKAATADAAADAEGAASSSPWFGQTTTDPAGATAAARSDGAPPGEVLQTPRSPPPDSSYTSTPDDGRRGLQPPGLSGVAVGNKSAQSSRHGGGGERETPRDNLRELSRLLAGASRQPDLGPPRPLLPTVTTTSRRPGDDEWLAAVTPVKDRAATDGDNAAPGSASSSLRRMMARASASPTDMLFKATNLLLAESARDRRGNTPGDEGYPTELLRPDVDLQRQTPKGRGRKGKARATRDAADDDDDSPDPTPHTPRAGLAEDDDDVDPPLTPHRSAGLENVPQRRPPIAELQRRRLTAPGGDDGNTVLTNVSIEAPRRAYMEHAAAAALRMSAGAGGAVVDMDLPDVRVAGAGGEDRAQDKGKGVAERAPRSSGDFVGRDGDAVNAMAADVTAPGDWTIDSAFFPNVAEDVEKLPQFNKTRRALDWLVASPFPSSTYEKS